MTGRWFAPTPLSRSWLLADGAAAAALLAIGIVEMRAAGDDIFFRSLDRWAVVLVVLQTLPAGLRRLAPVPALAVCVASQALAVSVGYPPTNAILAVPMALYTVAYVHDRRTTAVATCAAVAVFLPRTLGDAPGSTQLLLLSIVLFGAAALAGDGSKARRLYADAIEERARQAAVRREAEMREAVVEERARIARELHDAVGHTVNVLVVHAGAGRVAAAHDPGRAAEALAEIESIGRSALVDVDRLLGLLRDEQAVERQPTQGVADVPELVERIRTTGLDVTLELPDAGAEVPMAVGSAAYRIVQEALTNAIKHAGPARVSVRVVHAGGDLLIEVEDDGRGAGASAASGTRIGRGLIGMRERASLLGGELHAGPRAGGGYRVRARLPLVQAATTRRTSGTTT